MHSVTISSLDAASGGKWLFLYFFCVLDFGCLELLIYQQRRGNTCGFRVVMLFSRPSCLRRMCTNQAALGFSLGKSGLGEPEIKSPPWDLSLCQKLLKCWSAISDFLIIGFMPQNKGPQGLFWTDHTLHLSSALPQLSLNFFKEIKLSVSL